MTQQGLFERTKTPLDFDPVVAETVKRRAVKKVESHANPAWKTEMLSVFKQIALTHKEFTTDPVFELYAQDVTRPRTHTDRAMSGVIREAIKLGWITRIEGRVEKSNRVSNHRCNVQLYASLICRGDAAKDSIAQS